MTTRREYPSEEAHGQPMQIIEWVAPAGTDPHKAMLKAETALGVTLHYGDGVTDVHGYVNTSQRPDKSVAIAVHLYGFECVDPACHAGHGLVKFRKAPDVTTKLVAMVVAVGGQ